MAGQSSEFRKGLAFAARIGIELVVSLAVGLALGYLADTFFNTKPLFIFIGAVLGVSAGLLNVYRLVSRL